MRHLLRIVPLAAGLTLMATATLMAQTPAGACGLVVAADEKQVMTPYHSFVTTSVGGRTQTSEAITTVDATYVNVHGQWRRSPLTPKALLEQKRENVRNAKTFECQVVRDEAVNGAAATVYHVHTVMDEVGTADGQIWIAKGSGLPVKIEIDTDSGDGPENKRHTSTRFDYDNVQAPASVK